MFCKGSQHHDEDATEETLFCWLNKLVFQIFWNNWSKRNVCNAMGVVNWLLMFMENKETSENEEMDEDDKPDDNEV